MKTADGYLGGSFHHPLPSYIAEVLRVIIERRERGSFMRRSGQSPIARKALYELRKARNAEDPESRKYRGFCFICLGDDKAFDFFVPRLYRYGQDTVYFADVAAERDLTDCHDAVERDVLYLIHCREDGDGDGKVEERTALWQIRGR